MPLSCRRAELQLLKAILQAEQRSPEVFQHKSPKFPGAAFCVDKMLYNQETAAPCYSLVILQIHTDKEEEEDRSVSWSYVEMMFRLKRKESGLKTDSLTVSEDCC